MKYEVRIIGGNVIAHFDGWSDALEAMMDFPKPSEFRYVYPSGRKSEWVSEFRSIRGM